MCGFLGAFAPTGKSWLPENIQSFRESSARLAHRGNSSNGERVGATAALFHHRLAFRDLNEGRQPLTDSLGRATIIFNGELYDFRKLRSELAQHYDFRSKSDTEVILAAYLTLGADFVNSLDGEFAFVIHDHRTGQITAARDPYGVKPIFWHAENFKANHSLRTYQERYELKIESAIYFASEVKGLPIRLQWDRRGLDRQFFSLYEEMGTSFQNVFALAPGSVLTLKPDEFGFSGVMERKTEKRRRPTRPGTASSFEQKAHELREILQATVTSKLDSDVPLGAYLSGGIDSRIAAFEMARAGAKIKTFTVGFEGADYDETSEISVIPVSTSACPKIENDACNIE